MANPTTVTYEDGNNLAAGWISTDLVPLVADTYYTGMPLKYSIAGTVVDGVGNTGNGTVTAVTAGAGVPAGEWDLTFTAALVADLYNPDGDIVLSAINMADGAAQVVSYNGLQFTVTDGSTAFVADDTFAITVGTGGKYEYTTGTPDAIYNGPEKTLSADGYGSVIVAGELIDDSIVDDSGDALTLTEDERAAYRANGFYLKRS